MYRIYPKTNHFFEPENMFCISVDVFVDISIIDSREICTGIRFNISPRFATYTLKYASYIKHIDKQNCK